MNNAPNKLHIVVADDDHEDCEFLKRAFSNSNQVASLNFVFDGEELLHYLRREDKHSKTIGYHAPDIILLDLNMPRVNGREALTELRDDPQFIHTPVIILSTSSNIVDIEDCYNLGANSFITKPVGMQELQRTVDILVEYWANTVRLPSQ